MKVCAVTAALVCAGGGAIIGHASASGSATPPASLDHYLCVGELGGLCVPATTTLPDGTTVPVGNPRARLVCDRVHDGWRRHGKNDVAPAPTPVSVTNELSAAPVTLLSGRQEATCSVMTFGDHSGFSHDRANARATTGATFTCSAVQYPENASPKFDVPQPLKVGERLLVQVLDPAQLCVPAAPAGPAVAPTATSGADSLLCFRVRVAFRANHFFPVTLTLCVPTTVGGSAPGSPAPTPTVGATTTTAGSTTTTSTTTTTTTPRSTTTTGSTTTTSSTTSTSTTTATTQPATTTTTGPPPCPGILINGICLITV